MGCGTSKPQTPGPQEISKHVASHKGEVQRQSGPVKRGLSKQDEQQPVEPKYEEVRCGGCMGRDPSVQMHQFGAKCMLGIARGKGRSICKPDAKYKNTTSA